MLTFITKRVVAIVIIFFILVTVAFVLFRVVPSDPAAAMVISPRMSPELKEILRERFGLDKPLGQQYIIYLENVLKGDFGTSFYWQEDVFDIVKARLFPSLILTGTAVFIAVLIDFAAQGAMGRKSAIVNTFFYLIPFLFMGLLLILFFSYRLDLFPVGGMRSPEIWGDYIEASAGAKMADILYHLFLPLILMVIWVLVGFLPLVKATSQGVIQEKKALLPAGVTTLLAASVLFFGAKITESIFSWPGFHSAFIEATLNYDYPLALGSVIIGLLFCLVVALCMEGFYAGVTSLKSRASP
jgi:peptide/nickel transport system permease protein